MPVEWQRGILNYRGSETEPFRGDSIEELRDELIDALNYAREAGRQGHDIERIQRIQRDLHLLIDRVRVLPGMSGNGS